MQDRTKEIILKALLVLGMFFLVLPLGIAILSLFFEDAMPSEPVYERILAISFALLVVTGICFIVLALRFKIKPKPQKAERLPLLVNSFPELSEYLKVTILKQNYKIHDIVLAEKQGEMMVFTRKRFWRLDCLVVFRIPELTEELLNLSESEFSAFLTNYYGTDRITDEISLMSLICVDRITAPFERFVNNNIQQGFKSYKLPVGVSFGGKTIYIAKQKDGFAISKYKKLRKDFLKLMGNYANKAVL